MLINVKGLQKRSFIYLEKMGGGVWPAKILKYANPARE